MQENIMLIAPAVETNTQLLGNDIYVTAPWVMSERRAYEFIDGVVSLHNSKSDRSYIKGRVVDVINIGKVGSPKNRVAFVFKRERGAVNPTVARNRSAYVTETREQVRY
jgi:hypothetical protein